MAYFLNEIPLQFLISGGLFCLLLNASWNRIPSKPLMRVFLFNFALEFLRISLLLCHIDKTEVNSNEFALQSYFKVFIAVYIFFVYFSLLSVCYLCLFLAFVIPNSRQFIWFANITKLRLIYQRLMRQNSFACDRSWLLLIRLSSFTPRYRHQFHPEKWQLRSLFLSIFIKLGHCANCASHFVDFTS